MAGNHFTYIFVVAIAKNAMRTSGTKKMKAFVNIDYCQFWQNFLSQYLKLHDFSNFLVADAPIIPQKIYV